MMYYPPEPDETEREAFYQQAEREAIDDWLEQLDRIMERDRCSLSQARKTFDNEYRALYYAV